MSSPVTSPVDTDTDPHHGRFVVVPAAYVFLLRQGDAGPEVLLQLRRGTGYMEGH